MANIVDAIIIGGGPGGLSVGMAMARQKMTATIFDSGVYRNARAKHMHNVPGWDHRDPADFRAKIREDLKARYPTIGFRNTTVTQVKKLENGHFEALDTEGNTYTGRRLALATGVRDIMPDIPGYTEAWGRGIFHCLFCEGLEASGKPSAALLLQGLNTNMAAHGVRMVLQLAETARTYTNGDAEATAKARQAVAAETNHVSRINIETRKIASIELVAPETESAELKVTLEDGTEFLEGFMNHFPNQEVNGPFIEQLGLEREETMGVVVKVQPPMNMTNVPGVFVVGDAASIAQAVPNAINQGMFAGTGIVFGIQADQATGAAP